jgi:hypothetical protein
MDQMKLRNYTSTVPVSRSVGDIEELLVKAGATTVSKFYDDKKRLAGFLFQMIVNLQPITFKLPSNPDAVTKVMLAEIKKPHRGTKERVMEQAERTAWRLLHDWVHVQVSMILLEQAKAIQVFLPYVWNPESNRTLFEHYEANDFKQLKQLTEGSKK